MKKLSIFSAVILSLAVSGLTQAQQSASGIGSASAEIQSEVISIEEQQSLDFGQISPFSENGTLAISPRTNIQAPNSLIHTRSGTRGSWLVTGFPGASFAVTIDSEFLLTSQNGLNTMLVSDVVVGRPQVPGEDNGVESLTRSTLDGDGIRALTVGGVLNVGADQPSGVYNGQYQITVVYN